jgi:hypothetical protein
MGQGIEQAVLTQINQAQSQVGRVTVVPLLEVVQALRLFPGQEGILEGLFGCQG